MAESTKLVAKLHKKNSAKKIKDHAYLQLQYYDPVSTRYMPFPKDTPVNIIYVDDNGDEKKHSKNPLVIENSEGKVSFKIEHKTNLYFEIEFKETKYLNITNKSLVSQSDLDKLIQSDSLYLTKNMLFMLPKKISLKNSWWEITGKTPSLVDLLMIKRSVFSKILRKTKLKANLVICK